jgi:hypothetical protein
MKTEYNNIMREVNFFLKDVSLLYEACNNGTMTMEWINNHLNSIKRVLEVGLEIFKEKEKTTYVSKYDETQTELYTMLNQDYRSNINPPHYLLDVNARPWAFLNVCEVINVYEYAVQRGHGITADNSRRSHFFFRNLFYFDIYSNAVQLPADIDFLNGNNYHQFLKEYKSHPTYVPSTLRKYMDNKNYGLINDTLYSDTDYTHKHDRGNYPIHTYLEFNTNLSRKLLGRLYAIYLYIILIKQILGRSLNDYKPDVLSNIIQQLNDITDQLVNYGGNTKFVQYLTKHVLKQIIKQYKKIRRELYSFILQFLTEENLKETFDFLTPEDVEWFSNKCFETTSLESLIKKYTLEGFNTSEIKDARKAEFVAFQNKLKGRHDQNLQNDNVNNYLNYHISSDLAFQKNYFVSGDGDDQQRIRNILNNSFNREFNIYNGLFKYHQIRLYNQMNLNNESINWNTLLFRYHQFFSSILQLQSGLVMLGMLLKDQKLMLPVFKINKSYSRPVIENLLSCELFEALGRYRPEVMCTSKLVSLIHDIFYLTNLSRENENIRNGILIDNTNITILPKTPVLERTFMLLGAIRNYLDGRVAGVLYRGRGYFRNRDEYNVTYGELETKINNDRNISPGGFICHFKIEEDVIEKLFGMPGHTLFPEAVHPLIPNNPETRLLFGCQSKHKFIQKRPIHNTEEYRYLRTIFKGYTPPGEPKLTTNLYQIPRPIS